LGGVRWIVCGKSPTTTPEQFSYANLGGSWGTELKRAGYDGVIVQGESDTPVYLSITTGSAELKDASALWGKSTVETRGILKGQLGNQTRIVTTGPAGEHRVAMATILADNDASGSGGFGKEALAKIGKAEKERIEGIIRDFVSPDGAVITFQKDAYLAIKSAVTPGYGLPKAKAGHLVGTCQCDPDVRLFGLPPTRLLHGYLDLLQHFRDRILKAC